MSDLVLLLEVVGGTCAALALPLLVAETVEHRAGLATGWRAVCALVAAWLVALKNWLPRLRPLLDATAVLLLSVLFRAHGAHRGECDTRREVAT